MKRDLLELSALTLLGSVIVVAGYVLGPWFRAWECYAVGERVTVRSSGERGEVVGDPWYRAVPVRFNDGSVRRYTPERLK